MVQLMRPRKFLCGDMAATVPHMRGCLLAGIRRMPRAARFAGMGGRRVVRGVMTAGVGRLGVMSRFRGMFFGLAGCVRFVVRRGFRLLRPSRNSSDKSKTKQDQDNPQCPRNLSEKAEAIERP